MIAVRKRIDYSKEFDKQLCKASTKIKIAFRKRLEFFLQNEFSSILNNHSLTGNFSGFRSINITGDWRAIYRKTSDNRNDEIIIFVALGTHSQLYK